MSSDPSRGRESRIRSQHGPSMLPRSQHVDDVGQEHEADDGEEHQHQDVQHDVGRAAGPKDAEDVRRTDDGCVRWTGPAHYSPPSRKMEQAITGAKRWQLYS